ncbi:MAG: hypothetical protein EB084_24325, partial [Proteobacteria bacterium]|nr:hypothetical protein [Pseudomonadota bacterium]
TKQTLALTPTETTRQLALIHWLIEAGRHTQAINGMRAWVVNHVLQRLPWNIPRWLSRHERAPIEHHLDSVAYRARNGYEEPEEHAIAAIWKRLRALEGSLRDGGLTPDAITLSRGDIIDLYNACVALNDSEDIEPTYRPPEGRLVITPLGLAPGVLYAVARLLTPSHTLIVTSARGREREVEALTRAGFPDLRRTVRVLDDPFHCFDLAPKLATERAIRDLMLRHDEVVVNITGGTTAMQHVIERLGRESRALGKRTATVALIDRRDPAEQLAQPYVEGELVWLDETESEKNA